MRDRDSCSLCPAFSRKNGSVFVRVLCGDRENLRSSNESVAAVFIPDGPSSFNVALILLDLQNPLLPFHQIICFLAVRLLPLVFVIMEELAKSESVPKPRDKGSNVALVIAGVTGGLGLALTVVAVPFLTPALRRFALPYLPGKFRPPVLF